MKFASPEITRSVDLQKQFKFRTCDSINWRNSKSSKTFKIQIHYIIAAHPTPIKFVLFQLFLGKKFRLVWFYLSLVICGHLEVKISETSVLLIRLSKMHYAEERFFELERVSEFYLCWMWRIFWLGNSARAWIPSPGELICWKHVWIILISNHSCAYSSIFICG